MFPHRPYFSLAVRHFTVTPSHIHTSTHRPPFSPGLHFAINVQTHCMRLLFEMRNMIETKKLGTD